MYNPFWLGVSIKNSKLKLKLVAKRLYGADQMAVREMLHVANVLYEAVQLVRQGGAPRGGSMESSSQYAFNGHVNYSSFYYLVSNPEIIQLYLLNTLPATKESTATTTKKSYRKLKL